MSIVSFDLKLPELEPHIKTVKDSDGNDLKVVPVEFMRLLYETLYLRWRELAEDVEAASSAGPFVESVTGLNTDNTDPQNPIVKISVDGVTITGLGTPGSPLVGSGGTGLNSVISLIYAGAAYNQVG